ncbi:MAG: CHAT domain-containing protein [Cyclobacteriaceae bacterium]
MARPVIYLAFANNKQEAFLDLSREDDAIYHSFVSMEYQHDFQLHRDQFTSAKELIHFLNTFKNRISIFHFGGHAGQSSLYLADQAGREEGLISLLAQQKHLKLVFLNGCHTLGFVQKLLANGIPAVIATDRAIDDYLAVEFAESFYNAFTKGESIMEAFTTAKGAVQTTADKDIQFRSEGGDEIGSPEQGCPWGVYSKDPQSLDWKVTKARTDVLNLPGKFWVRFAILLFAIFAIFTWSNRHIGASSTMFFLANGPLALIGISAFLLKRFENLSPGLASIGKRISWFFLKTPVLLVIGLMVLALGLVGSSVKVNHEGENALEMHLTDQHDNKIAAWPISANDGAESRMLALANPFSMKKKLHVKGYHPIEIDLKPLVGNRLSTEELTVRSSLLIRLNLSEIALATRIKILIDRLEHEQIVIDPIDKAAALLGPQVVIADTTQKRWEDHLISMQISSRQLIDLCLQQWADPNHVNRQIDFVPGEDLQIAMLISDSLVLEKEITIKNQSLNDVLLER